MREPVALAEAPPVAPTALIGSSRAMREVCKEIGRVAARPVTVLIRVKPVPARNSSPAPSTSTATVPRPRSLRSTAAPFRKPCWKANSSAMNTGPSPARCSGASAASNRRISAPCSWMKWRPQPQHASQAAARLAGQAHHPRGRRCRYSRGRARDRRHTPRFGDADSRRPLPPGPVLPSERVTIRVPSLRERRKTSRRSSGISCRNMRRVWTRSSVLSEEALGLLEAAPGPAMSVSWKRDAPSAARCAGPLRRRPRGAPNSRIADSRFRARRDLVACFRGGPAGRAERGELNDAFARIVARPSAKSLLKPSR